MQKCYISGAITGCDNYQQKFEKACATVTELGYHPVNPCWLNHKANSTWIDYMRTDIIALMECDVIYMLPCWKGSKGAVIEHYIAEKSGMKIIYEL